MAASTAILYLVFFTGLAVLTCAWAAGEARGDEIDLAGRSPDQPDLRLVVAVEQPAVRRAPPMSAGRHA